MIINCILLPNQLAIINNNFWMACDLFNSICYFRENDQKKRLRQKFFGFFSSSTAYMNNFVCFQSKARIGSSFCREKKSQKEDLKRAIIVVADVVCWILSTVQIGSCIKTVLLNWKSVKRCSIKAHPKYVYRKCERKRWFRFSFFSLFIYNLFYLHWTSE